MANKIYFKHTIEEYNKKYADKDLNKVNKVDADNDETLLDDKTWWLIDDIYYEVPASRGLKGWWNNLTKTRKIVMCCLVGVLLVTSIVTPIAVGCNKNVIVEHIAVIDPSVKDVTCTQKKLDNGALEVTLLYDSSKKELKSLEINMGNEKLVLYKDYSLNGNIIVINKDVLDNNKTVEIIIKPNLKDKNVYVDQIKSINSITMTEGETISFDKLNISVLPENATDKSYKIKDYDKGDLIEIDENKKTITAIKSSDKGCVIWFEPNNPNPDKKYVFCATAIYVEPKERSKKKFLKLYNEFKEAFKINQDIYTKNEIEYVHKIIDGTEYPVLIDDFIYSSENENVNISFTNEDQTVTGRIDINQYDLDTLETLLETESDLSKYEDGTNDLGVKYIKYTSTSGTSQIKELIVNEYGIIESNISKDNNGYTLIVKGKPEEQKILELYWDGSKYNYEDDVTIVKNKPFKIEIIYNFSDIYKDLMGTTQSNNDITFGYNSSEYNINVISVYDLDKKHFKYDDDYTIHNTHKWIEFNINTEKILTINCISNIDFTHINLYTYFA